MTGHADFYHSTPEDQIARLAKLTEAALPEWGLAGATITPIAYRENMTFRVDSGARGTFAFRIHQAYYRTDQEIKSELDFMSYLSGEGILTPRVVPAKNGALFATVSSDGVPEPRQCDVFEWITGRPMRETGQALSLPIEEATRLYLDVGRIAADIHNAAERWERPAGFERPTWDAEGIFGENAYLGDFRKLTDVSDQQRRLFLDVADKLSRLLDEFGKGPDRFGLSHCDFLGENIFISDEGLRLLDFDDSGDSWYLFDLVTAVFDLFGTPAFEPCLESIVTGYRERRPLPEEHLEMIPAFILLRILSYLGWCAKKAHMPQSAWMKPLLLYAAETQGAEFLAATAS